MGMFGIAMTSATVFWPEGHIYVGEYTGRSTVGAEPKWLSIVGGIIAAGVNCWTMIVSSGGFWDEPEEKEVKERGQEERSETKRVNEREKSRAVVQGHQSKCRMADGAGEGWPNRGPT